jgi:hypothetical protein
MKFSFNKKMITLLLFVIMILVILYFVYYRKNIENFTNNNYPNTYIINGSFNDEKPIVNSSLLGNSEIIEFANNPGNSKYVLKCKNNSSTGIKININGLTANDIYKFSFYYDPNSNINISNYIKFSIINTNNQKVYLSQKFYQNTKPLVIQDNKWYYSSSVITIPEDTNTEKNMTIEVLNTSSLPISQIYTTDYKFYKVLSDDENYELTKNLKLLLLTQSVDTSSKKWSDYSGYHNNFYFTPNTPTINDDKKVGGVSLNNNKLIGPICNKVFGYKSSEFSIVFSIFDNNQPSIKNEEEENQKEYSEEELISGESISEENINDYVFLTVPGNQKYLLKVFLKDDYISIYANDGQVNIFRDNIVFNKSIMSIVYNDNTLNLYQNGTLIESVNCNNAVFYPSQDKNIIINNNENINVYMNYFSIYDTALTNDDYNTIDDYFKGYFNPHNGKIIIINPPTPSPEEEEENNNQKDKCIKSCDDLCKNVNYDSDLYKKCKDNYCKYTNECVEYCKNNNDDNLCNDDFNYNSLNCPHVYIKNGNYYVYIPDSANYTIKKGELDYGSLRSKARRLFKLNFPNCPIPDILKYPGGVHPSKKCPYLVHNQSNPCNDNECDDVDWSVSPYKQNISKKCKQKISNYCRLYHDIDPKNCKCWTDEYKNKQVCYDHRRYFEDPNDYQCCIKSFKISEHPDFNEYVKKDKVPCYGCDIK